MFKVLLYNNLNHHTLVDIGEADNIITKAYEMLDFVKEGNVGWSGTDIWMNRFTLVSSQYFSYIIIPSVAGTYGNIIEATKGKFIVYKHGNNDIHSMTDEDVAFLDAHLMEQFTETEIKTREERNKKADLNNALFTAYREVTYMLPDQTVELLRQLFDNHQEDLIRPMIGEIEKIIDPASLNEHISQSISEARDRFKRDYGNGFAEVAYDMVAPLMCLKLYSAEFNFSSDFSIMRIFDDTEKRAIFVRALEPETIRVYKQIKEYLRTGNKDCIKG